MLKKVIVAKKFGEIGSYVYDNVVDDKFRTLFNYLDEELLGTDIEIVLVNGIEAYKEYYPITRITDSKEFVKKVFSMIS